MIPVYIKSVNERAYVYGFSVNPLIQERMQQQGSLTNPGQGPAFKKVRQQVWVPTVLVVTESKTFGMVPLGDVVPLITDAEVDALKQYEVPDDVKKEGEELAKELKEMEDKAAAMPEPSTEEPEVFNE